MNKSQGQSFEEEVLFIACKKNIIFTYYGQLLYVAYYFRYRAEKYDLEPPLICLVWFFFT